MNKKEIYLFKGNQEDLVNHLKEQFKNPDNIYEIIGGCGDDVIIYSYMDGGFMYVKNAPGFVYCEYSYTMPTDCLNEFDCYDICPYYLPDDMYDEDYDIINNTFHLNSIEKMLEKTGASENFITDLINLLNGCEYDEMREYDD